MSFLHHLSHAAIVKWVRLLLYNFLDVKRWLTSTVPTPKIVSHGAFKEMIIPAGFSCWLICGLTTAGGVDAFLFFANLSVTQHSTPQRSSQMSSSYSTVAFLSPHTHINAIVSHVPTSTCPSSADCHWLSLVHNTHTHTHNTPRGLWMDNGVPVWHR